MLNIHPDPNASDFKDPKSIRGKIPADGTGIFVIGDPVQSGKSYWVPIVWKETRGWINRNYIVQDKSKEMEKN